MPRAAAQGSPLAAGLPLLLGVFAGAAALASMLQGRAEVSDARLRAMNAKLERRGNDEPFDMEAELARLRARGAFQTDFVNKPVPGK